MPLISVLPGTEITNNKFILPPGFATPPSPQLRDVMTIRITAHSVPSANCMKCGSFENVMTEEAKRYVKVMGSDQNETLNKNGQTQDTGKQHKHAGVTMPP